MPNIKSAAKRVRVTQRKTEYNKRIKSRVKTAVRNFEKAIITNNTEEAGKKLRGAISTLDKAVTKGVLHKNTASRKKARLVKRYNKIAG
ncbi:MAG: 30S ribosomal protein S20 [Clostridiales bacterium]|nr:30S ribosomal protein S20 [Clostridiales bacterium]MCF8021463.1 30S ribosomal protein S20 [Clostridiales bacterium]